MLSDETKSILMPLFVFANAVAMLYVSEKFVSVFYDFESKRSDDDDDKKGLPKDRNLSRSSRFLARAFCHHLLVKGKYVIHGVGGMGILATSLACIVWYHVAGTRGPAPLQQSFTCMLVFFSLGMLTPYMVRKQRSLASRQYTLQKHMLIVVANGAMAKSTYASVSFFLPTISTATTDLLEQQHQEELEKVCTWVAFTLFPVAFFVQLFELRNRYVWSTKGMLVSFIPPFPLVYGPFLYGQLYGTAALEQLYATTRLADALYLLNIGSLFCVSIDQFLLTMVVRKVVSMEQRIRLLGAMWPMFGVYCAFVLGSFVSVPVAVAHLLLVGLQFPAARLIPKWYLANFEENSKGIYFRENAGNKISMLRHFRSKWVEIWS